MITEENKTLLRFTLYNYKIKLRHTWKGKIIQPTKPINRNQLAVTSLYINLQT